MTIAARQAVAIAPPTNGSMWIYTLGTTHGVELVPQPIIDRYSTWFANGTKAYLIFGTSAAIEADKSLTASVITAVDTDAIKLSIATSASAQTYAPAALDGTVGDDAFTSPTIASVTGDGHANIDACSVVFTALQYGTGQTIYCTAAVTNALSGTVYATSAVDLRGAPTSPYITQVTSIAVPAQSGTGGLFEFGLYERVAASVNACLPIPQDTAVQMRIPFTLPFFSHEADAAGKLIVWLSTGS